MRQAYQFDVIQPDGTRKRRTQTANSRSEARGKLKRRLQAGKDKPEGQEFRRGWPGRCSIVSIRKPEKSKGVV